MRDLSDSYNKSLTSYTTETKRAAEGGAASPSVYHLSILARS